MHQLPDDLSCFRLKDIFRDEMRLFCNSSWNLKFDFNIHFEFRDFLLLYFWLDIGIVYFNKSSINRILAGRLELISAARPNLASYYLICNKILYNIICINTLLILLFTSNVTFSILLPLQRKPCNRAKINCVSICRRQFSLTYSVMGWEKKVWMLYLFNHWKEFN